MMISRLYVGLVSAFIEFLEELVFQPKVNRFYRSKFSRQDGLVILDIGANKGQSIRTFKSLFPNSFIHSFEPNQKLFTALRKKFNGPGIALYNYGISGSDGERPFYENLLESTSSMEPIDLSSDYVKLKSSLLLTTPEQIVVSSYNVPVRSLSSFVASAGITKLDIVKIDVEGHEVEVVRGMLVAIEGGVRFGFIQIEEHFDGQYLKGAESVADLLGKAGYDEVQRVKHAFGNFYDVIYSKRDE